MVNHLTEDGELKRRVEDKSKRHDDPLMRYILHDIDEAKKELWAILYTPEKLDGTVTEFCQKLGEILDVQKRQGRISRYTQEDYEFTKWVLKWFGE